MPVLLFCGCFLLLWHHTLLQRLPWWLSEDDQCPQRGTAPLSCRTKRQAAGGNRVPFACSSPTNRGGVRPGMWGVQKCPHLLNKTQDFNWKPVCLLWFLAAVKAQPWSLALAFVKSPGHWTRFLLSRQESSGLPFYHHQYPSSAMNTSCGSFWMQSNLNEKKNNRNLKKKKKRK